MVWAAETGGVEMLPENWLEQLKNTYPKRSGDQGWADVRKQVARRIEEGHTFETILRGAQNYAIHCGRKQYVGSEYVKQCATFVGPGLWFEEWAGMDLRTPQQIADETRWQHLEDRARALGFQTVDRVRGYSVALAAVEAAERQRDGEIVRGLKLVKTV